MSNLTTTTIQVPEEPATDALRKRLAPESRIEALRTYNVVLEHTTDGVRSVIFLSLYMPSQQVKEQGGTQALMPGWRAGDVLGAHGMRFRIEPLVVEGETVILETKRKKLPESESQLIRSTLAALLAANETNPEEEKG